MIDLIKKVRMDEAAGRLKNIRIAVVGDMMLDVYHHGRVERISPEAPVPVVHVSRIVRRPGGAANVCRNIVSLTAACSAFGVIGSDSNGEMLNGLFSEDGIDTSGLVTSQGRPTTTKLRVLSHAQQLIRMDYEESMPLSSDAAAELTDRLHAVLPRMDAVILQDYNKGLLTPELISGIISAASERNVPVFVDPKYENFMSYRGVYLFKPNRREAAALLDMPIDTVFDAEEAARRLRDLLQCRNVLITLGSLGMVLLNEQDQIFRIPTRARTIHDVTGAGDTVISTVAAFCAAGCSLEESTVIANLAAGRVCEEVGIIPITLNSLREIVRMHQN